MKETDKHKREERQEREGDSGKQHPHRQDLRENPLSLHPTPGDGGANQRSPAGKGLHLSPSSR